MAYHYIILESRKMTDAECELMKHSAGAKLRQADKAWIAVLEAVEERAFLMLQALADLEAKPDCFQDHCKIPLGNDLSDAVIQSVIAYLKAYELDDYISSFKLWQRMDCDEDVLIFPSKEANIMDNNAYGQLATALEAAREYFASIGPARRAMALSVRIDALQNEMRELAEDSLLYMDKWRSPAELELQLKQALAYLDACLAGKG